MCRFLQAVRASSSLAHCVSARPASDGADYIDGAVEKNFHLDVAIAHGAELIVCINPLVPLMNDPAQAAVPIFFGKSGRYLSQKGLPSVLDQAFKLILHSRMRSGFEMALQKAPHVDVVMIEPHERDFKMFFYNILRYSARIILAKHGFEGAREIIESNFEDLRSVFAKHDIELSRERLDETFEALNQDERSPSVAVAALAKGCEEEAAACRCSTNRLSPEPGERSRTEQVRLILSRGWVKKPQEYW